MIFILCLITAHVFGSFAGYLAGGIEMMLVFANCVTALFAIMLASNFTDHK